MVSLLLKLLRALPLACCTVVCKLVAYSCKYKAACKLVASSSATNIVDGTIFACSNCLLSPFAETFSCRFHVHVTKRMVSRRHLRRSCCAWDLVVATSVEAARSTHRTREVKTAFERCHRRRIYFSENERRRCWLLRSRSSNGFSSETA